MGGHPILLDCFTVCFLNMRSLIILLLLVAHTKGNQLDKLINFAKGSGPNPSGGTRSSSHPSAPSPQRSNPGREQNTHASPRRPTATIASPIPFAELADPSRGQVQLDVPQPKYVGPIPEHSQTVIGAHTSQQVIAASTPPPFKGLPAGATQVGGNPVRIATVKPTKPKPAPLSQINPPIYLSETFPSPLNTIDPARAPLQEPVEALQHRFQPGTRPQPLPVQNQNLAGLMALKNNERRVQSQNFNYNSIVGEVFNQPQGQPQPQQQQFLQSRQQQINLHDGQHQTDLSHEEALKRHFQQVEQVKLLQQRGPQHHHIPQHQVQQPQHHHIPHQAQQPQQVHRNPSPLQPVDGSHFAIPALNQAKQYEDELRLAQETLKRLG